MQAGTGAAVKSCTDQLAADAHHHGCGIALTASLHAKGAMRCVQEGLRALASVAVWRLPFGGFQQCCVLHSSVIGGEQAWFAFCKHC